MANLQGRLSQRQRQILQRIANGQHRHEIGQELYVSESTVSRALTESQRRLGANSVPHAVAKAIAAKIIHPPPTPQQPSTESQSAEEASKDAPAAEPTDPLLAFITRMMDDAPWDDLTSRVQEVFFAFGKHEQHESPSNAAIAKEVNLSKESMRQYSRRIKRGLGVSPDADDARKQMQLLARIAVSLTELQQECAKSEQNLP